MSRIVSATGRGVLPDVRRINFCFSGGGRYAACLVRRGHRLAPELWDLTGSAPRARILHGPGGESPQTTPVATDDGRVLLCRPDGGVHRLLLAVPSRDGDAPAEERRLATVGGPALRLLAGPVPGTAALAFEADTNRRTTVWRLSGRDEPPEPIAELPVLVNGGVWLDGTGDRLALASGRAGAGGTVVLDLSRGVLAPLGGLAGDEHLLLAAPRTGVLLTAARRDGAYRLGVRRHGHEGPTAFPDRLNAIEGGVTPLALDPAGRHLALAVTRGVRSHLLLHDLVEDACREVDLPAGVLYRRAHWGDTGLHLVHSTPDHPPVLITAVRPSRSRAVRRLSRPRWAQPSVRGYDGPAGDIEAVVYGDPGAARRAVLALHGGPESSWQLGFDPLFRRLAAAGIAVVAPNQRGSTGYGAAHRDAVRGAWGGPDLDDVLHLGRALSAARGPGRERPMLYGPSYGAYLALLAAAARPGLWSRAAVVAPFLSGRHLHADGPPEVRHLIDRLGGREEIDDDLGPRDLLRLADRMRLPLLIVHGEQDPVIPVAHSRRLRDRLCGSGHRGGADLTYLEVPGAGHDPLSEAGGHLVLDRVVGFLSEGAGRRPLPCDRRNPP
ncbi:prolyl oligopeptidase family serine peptidase [Planomonospora sp. ID67723]|uniref:prolyl oligopeptidase family serine peptidase n=1 Tax=Planomonospora sp. ID67723 TaxID=2738134 RepID=UPI0018C3A80A|nr:prolyl oligopeptidase family serine peptidase [Planomonospora sp. ID67723]MBG0831218.1 prolyl oligopeptidase family serine peptidase [Planomonospora sp. ID67723]